MSAFSIGDLAQSLMLRRHGVNLKSELTRLSEELVTGQVSDTKTALAGTVSYLTDIENDMRKLDGYGVAAAEAGQFAESMQLALERAQNVSSDFSTTLLTASASTMGQVLNQVVIDATNELASVVSALNTSVGGRSLFSGSATHQPALADVQTIIDGLRLATAGALTPEELITAADVWFDDPAGFAATAYSGSSNDLEPFRLSEGDTVAVQYTADDVAFRDIIKSIAVAAVANDVAYGFDTTAKRDLLARTGTDLYESQTGLIAVRADVGSSQERIDVLRSRHAAERTSLELAKSALLQADPYETATKLEEVQFQLQSLYTVTARTSDLSLVNFIR